MCNLTISLVDKPMIERALELKDKYDQSPATIGWHPTEVGPIQRMQLPWVIGLDYHWRP